MSPFEHVETGYDSGDLGMQHNNTLPYSPLETRKSASGDRGSYTHVNTPRLTFDLDPNLDNESLVDGHSHDPNHHGHVKRFDHRESRMKLLRIGGSKLLITILFSALICICLKAWEGFHYREGSGHHKIVLSKKDVRIFNAIMISTSLCLGLNLLSSLKHYANTFRWTFLARRYLSLETFDLILHASSLVQVTKLMVISMPGIRGRTFVRRLPWFREARSDNDTQCMWLVCTLWLFINIGSQVLVALLSLFWPVENSLNPLMAPGNVTVADMSTWDSGQRSGNATSMENAWQFGMEGQFYPEYPMDQNITDLGSLPGMPIYTDSTGWEYRFFNRNPQHPFTNYVPSQRKVQAHTTCEQLEVNGTVHNDDDNNMYIQAKAPGQNWTNYRLPQSATGSITWIPATFAYCGSRCTNFTVLQRLDTHNVTKTSMFFCNSTLANVTKAEGKDDIRRLTKEDELSVYGSESFARIATGAIGWTGISWNSWKDRQARTYTQGTKWSPPTVVSVQEVETMLSRFTIGAIAAFDDHGPRYNVQNQVTVPTQGQQLDVDWPWIYKILGAICGIQLVALVLLVALANRAIVRDESYFSMAMLLSPVVSRIGPSGMHLNGEEIEKHEKLQWNKIRYDCREGRNGAPNQVDIFFEGKDQKEGRKSWAAGS
ncbi:hypothetical protein ACEQ8H_008363 [Pleosporales sp. CAS-2024a]